MTCIDTLRQTPECHSAPARYLRVSDETTVQLASAINHAEKTQTGLTKCFWPRESVKALKQSTVPLFFTRTTGTLISDYEDFESHSRHPPSSTYIEARSSIISY